MSQKVCHSVNDFEEQKRNLGKCRIFSDISPKILYICEILMNIFPRLIILRRCTVVFFKRL